MPPSYYEPGVGGNSERAFLSQQCSVQPSSVKPPRRSVFKEECLDDLDLIAWRSPELKVRVEGRKGIQELRDKKETLRPAGTRRKSSWYIRIRQSPRSSFKTISTLPRLALVAFLVAVVVPAFRYSSEERKVAISGTEARLVRRGHLVEKREVIERRGNSSTAVCTRWGHQTTNVNGTLYIYGGQATTEARQSSDTWNNNFFTLDLTKSWRISAPAFSGLPRPSGPPQVAEGYLWNTYDSLFLYGGEFSDNPPAVPLSVSTWEYHISSTTWIEHPNPQTSAGNNSDGGGVFVQRAAEGAGLSVPELGKSWYFGGHLDLYTTPGWSNQIARVYLKSLLEFTHPGYTNTGVYTLGTTAAGSEGVYRNITSGGLEADFGFTERADGVLVFIPGWGAEGIILGLAGGTNETFTEMNVIDVFDIASSAWYKQSTSGGSPPIRVNPCAVVAAAADGSSFNVYLYGGQNLLPFGSQTQYTDMWILTIPSFTWIQVDLDGQSQPPARAGHTCNMWDGQMVVVGGYVGKDISCDSPGVYVFNASSLQWSNTFTANALDRNEQDSSILRGSNGYQVPSLVQSVIGGSGSGGATASIPAVGLPSTGPLATGRPPTITVTRSGITIVQTSQSTATVSLTAPSATNASSASKTDSNVGTITAGVAAAIFALLAAYLAFCSWLYRRQLRIYKNHVAMAQRTAFSTEHRAWNASARSEDDTGRQINEGEAKAGVMLGPFGTTITGTSSAPGVSTTASSVVSPGRSNTNGRPSAAGSSGARLSGGDGSGDYGRTSDADEEMSDYLIGNRISNNWPLASGTTGHSSMEDLLGGQEPSFFSVVLNPRRTLRVVNSD